MASNSPPYPPMHEWKLRLVSSTDSGVAKVYGPPHPDGSNYAYLFLTFDKEFAAQVVKRWNAYKGDK